jgi:hypothetical protein
VLVIAMPRLCINTLYNKHLRDTIPFAKNHTVFAESVRGVIASSFLAKQSPDMARRLLQPAPNAGFAMTLIKKVATLQTPCQKSIHPGNSYVGVESFSDGNFIRCIYDFPSALF